MQLRPRRSVLYIPGDKPRVLEKARELAADVLILDLEDSVAPEAKIVARAGFGDGGGLWEPRNCYSDQWVG